VGGCWPKNKISRRVRIFVCWNLLSCLQVLIQDGHRALCSVIVTFPTGNYVVFPIQIESRVVTVTLCGVAAVRRVLQKLL